jgi:uncharacterized membrane protein YhhN
MMTGWFLLGLGFGIADWAAVALDWRRLEYVAKPAVMISLIVAYAGSLRSPPDYALVFGFGLVCCLAGDVLLMLPGNRFLAGLLAFLTGHICTSYALLSAGKGLAPWWPALAMILLILAAGLTAFLASRLISSGRGGLIFPVTIYAAALATMTFSAISRLADPEWTGMPGLAVAAGGILFFLSDSALAIRRFAVRLPGGRLFEHFTYHLAQIALSWSMAAHLAPWL